MSPARYKLAEATINERDIGDLIEWLRTDPWLTQGPLVAEFERVWAAWLGTRHALFVNSGSSANLLMYAALESAKRGNRKVIVPAVSWPTTVAPAIQLGFEPIMCDAEDVTFGIDPRMLAEMLEEHEPAAVIVVHVLGVPIQLDPILQLQRKHGFVLLEDCCAAHGSRYDGRRVGSFGQMSSFSFFYGHHVSTIEGGMVCTDDDRLDDILRMLRSHGWHKDLAPEKGAALASGRDVIEFNQQFTFYLPGYNLRSTDLNARIGLSQMRRADDVVQQRMSNHREYQARFAAARAFHCQRNGRAEVSGISFAALASSREHRERIAAAMKTAGIETRPIGGGNMSRQPFWSDRYGSQTFPVADRIHETGFQIPNHQGLDTNSVGTIADVVLSVQP